LTGDKHQGEGYRPARVVDYPLMGAGWEPER
jgi:hypothetical protein